jgi:hypothetical protein
MYERTHQVIKSSAFELSTEFIDEFERETGLISEIIN